METSAAMAGTAAVSSIENAAACNTASDTRPCLWCNKGHCAFAFIAIVSLTVQGSISAAIQVRMGHAHGESVS